ncbi:hypothetical protein QK384_29240, partial [Pseudomonas aeruginosa]|nr:hypothetical protein [Pseudomonas aeruginosa]
NSTTGYHLQWPKKNSTHCPGWVDHYRQIYFLYSNLLSKGSSADAVKELRDALVRAHGLTSYFL